MSATDEAKRMRADRRRRAPAKRTDPIDWLDKRTGEPTGYWINAVQQAIAASSTPARTRGKYKGHSTTNVTNWTRMMVSLVNVKAGISKNKDRDENMGMAATLGLVLCAWYVRIHRAKAFDPRRPIKLRKAAMLQANDFVAELARALHDDTWDPFCFRDQEWENPWLPKARDGKFV